LNYRQLCAYLESSWPKGSAERPATSYPFDQLQALLGLLGRPERGLEIVGVTGTKGKGSIARLTAAILQAHGLSSGLFTSPHLIRIEERLLLDGRPLPPGAFARLFSRVLAARDRAGLDGLSVTPVLLAMALTWFQEAGARVAVLEVRSGGRFDPTAVAAPRTVCLGPIGLEHVPGLGYSLAEIAWQKIGLAAVGAHCFLAAQPPEAAAVIRREGRNLGARLHWLGTDLGYRLLGRDERGQRLRLRTPGGSFEVPRLGLLGEHQAANATLAAAAAEAVLNRFDRRLEPVPLARALRTTRWPARLERLRARPLVLYDGAHTPESAAALAAALADHFPGRRWTFLVGMLTGKQADGFLRALAPLADRLLTVPVPGFRHQSAEALAASGRALGLQTEPAPDLPTALALVQQPGASVCVTGTLYLYAASRQATRTRPGATPRPATV
jgi:dihydrofolate synthase/folylpolyglutamate synthase